MSGLEQYKLRNKVINKINIKKTMIQLLILIPVLGSLILLPIKEISINSKNQIRNIAVITSLINFIVTIIIWINFD